MTQSQNNRSDLRLVIPATAEEIESWLAETSLSRGDFYRIAAAARLDVLPDEVTIEQRTLMKVTLYAGTYSIQTDLPRRPRVLS